MEHPMPDSITDSPPTPEDERDYWDLILPIILPLDPDDEDRDRAIEERNE